MEAGELNLASPSLLCGLTTRFDVEDMITTCVQEIVREREREREERKRRKFKLPKLEVLPSPPSPPVLSSVTIWYRGDWCSKVPH